MGPGGPPTRSLRAASSTKLGEVLSRGDIAPAELLLGHRLLLPPADVALDVRLLLRIADGFLQETSNDGAPRFTIPDQPFVDSLEQAARNAHREATHRTH